MAYLSRILGHSTVGDPDERADLRGATRAARRKDESAGWKDGTQIRRVSGGRSKVPLALRVSCFTCDGVSFSFLSGPGPRSSEAVSRLVRQRGGLRVPLRRGTRQLLHLAPARPGGRGAAGDVRESVAI